ncbi:hypothetical protein TKK_0006426 [Trichogramma kaykai]|uniref:Uncharacterized protein n=1 Tax=Trichogramma kaykai TaxID=54128 RepID=A0ABD2XDR3_9HYME
MSINVTVKGNPISIRKGKMILSDLDKIKKYDRDQRKKLRLEQVQEQNKIFSRNLLERVKLAERESHRRLADDDHNELTARERDRKLQEVRRRCPESEFIGYAHENAARQPDVEAIRRAEDERNRLRAKERGAEAARKLREAKNAQAAIHKVPERLRKARELENERSSMVARLAQKAHSLEEHAESSDNNFVNKTVPPVCLKKKPKCVVPKKSPVKKSKSSKVSKNVPRVSVTINNDNITTLPSDSCRKNIDKKIPNNEPDVPKTILDSMKDKSRDSLLESDDNEPRKIVPTTSQSSEKPENLLRYNKQSNNLGHSSSELSSTSTVFSSTNSEDSSYFSDNVLIKTSTRKPNLLKPPSSTKSTVDMYNYKTRQNKSYDHPSDLVEKVNDKNKPRAETLAQELRKSESRNSEVIEKLKDLTKKRSEDAIARENIARDYKELLKYLDRFEKESKKFKTAELLNNAPLPRPSKKIKDETKRQKKMDRALQEILRTSRNAGMNLNSQTERPITITPRDYIHDKPTPVNTWSEAPFTRNPSARNDDNDDYTDESYNDVTNVEAFDERNVIKALIKIDQLKRNILQDYGASLPDSILQASRKPLFANEQTEPYKQPVEQPQTCTFHHQHQQHKPQVPSSMMSSSSQEKVECCHSSHHHDQSEIQMINLSRDDAVRPPKKIFTTKTSTCSQKSSRTESTVSMQDQQVQVELESNKSCKKVRQPVKKRVIEPTVKIVSNAAAADSGNDSSTSSTSSTTTDMVIDVNNKEITVVPKTRDSSVKISKSTSTSSASVEKQKSKSFQLTYDPVKGVFEVDGYVIDPEKKEIIVRSRVQKASDPRKSKHDKENSVKNKSTSTNTEMPPPKTKSTSTGTSTVKTKEKLSASKKAKLAGKLFPYLPTSSKSRSLPGSRMQSPVKKQPKSVPNSPKKSRKSLQEEREYRHQFTQVSIDSSTTTTDTSSLLCSDSNGSKRLYCRIETVAAQKYMNRRQDISDGSTIYASPPQTTPGMYIDQSANNHSTSINDMLDANGSLKRRVTPEPSPMPESLKLLYMMSTKGDAAATVSAREKAHSENTCQCKNPTCKLLHNQVDDALNYALNHGPEILKEYDKLQYTCHKRIESLTDLITTLRKEKKDMEFSAESLHDHSAPIAGFSQSSRTSQRSQQLHQQRSQTSSQTGKSSELMKKIETVHSALKKTFTETERKIVGKSMQETPRTVTTTDHSSNSTIELSKDSTIIISDDEEDQTIVNSSKSPAKPKILKDERVNVDLSLLRQQSRNKSPEPTRSSVDPNNGDPVVKMLSKEILEQSKSINKSTPNSIKSKSDVSPSKHSSQGNAEVEPVIKETPVRDLSNQDRNSPSNQDLRQNNLSDNSNVLNSEYEPFLAGIPKINRNISTSNNSERSRPPVTLISRPFKPEVFASPAHELSTIVEFDTPNTQNKSQVSTRSPSTKCRRKIAGTEETQSTASSPSKSTSDPFKIPKLKPSVHVAPFPALRSPQQQHQQQKQQQKQQQTQQPQQHFNKLSAFAKSTLVKNMDKSMEKSIESLDKLKKASSDSMHTLPDMVIELQQSQDNNDGYERISQISMYSLPDENIDDLIISDICEESKSKSTTPALNSNNSRDGNFSNSNSRNMSGLSGVSEITSSHSSDRNRVKCPSEPEEMEEGLKQVGLFWAASTLKKTREASALGSSSSSEGTPVNTGTRLVSPFKKQQDGSIIEIPEISDVSSISIKHTNMSTDRSILVKGRCSTPNRKLGSNNSNTSNYSVKRSNPSEHGINFNHPNHPLNPNISHHSTCSDRRSVQSNNQLNSNGCYTTEKSVHSNHQFESIYSNRGMESIHSNRVVESIHSTRQIETVNSNNEKNSFNGSDSTISTLASIRSVNVVHNESADVSIPNISFPEKI